MGVLGRSVASLGLLALLAVPALGQQRGGGVLFGGTLNTLLTNASVHKELMVTTEQAAKLKARAAQERETNQRLRRELAVTQPGKAMEKQAELMKAASDATWKALDEILKPEQLVRLEQIRLQMDVVASMSEPEVQEKLKLTSEQRDRIKDMTQEYRSEMRKLGLPPASNDREGTMLRMLGLRDETSQKMIDLLSAAQKATWKESVGEPFEVKLERPTR